MLPPITDVANALASIFRTRHLEHRLSLRGSSSSAFRFCGSLEHPTRDVQAPPQ